MTRSSADNVVRLRRLLALAQDLMRASDVKSVMETAAQAIPELLRADGSLLLVAIGEQEYVIELDSHGAIQEAHGTSELLRFARQAMGGQATVPPPSVVVCADFLDGRGVTSNNVSILTFPFPPIKPVGVLAAYWCRCSRTNDLTGEISIIQHLGNLIGAALAYVACLQLLRGQLLAQSLAATEAAHQYTEELLRRDGLEEEMHRLSVTDMMTGMLNRRGFFLHAERGFKLARRQGLPSTIIFVDIDGLKTVNDQFGHDTGDCLIKDTAFILQKAFRDSDVVARLGGDEFAAFTLNSGEPQIILDRLQQYLDDFRSRSTSPYRVSFSTGIVQCDPLSAITLSDYLCQADAQMYEQKKKRLK